MNRIHLFQILLSITPTLAGVIRSYKPVLHNKVKLPSQRDFERENVVSVGVEERGVHSRGVAADLEEDGRRVRYIRSLGEWEAKEKEEGILVR
jgi:hypothetical protein